MAGAETAPTASLVRRVGKTATSKAAINKATMAPKGARTRPAARAAKATPTRAISSKAKAPKTAAEPQLGEASKAATGKLAINRAVKAQAAATRPAIKTPMRQAGIRRAKAASKPTAATPRP